MWGAHCLPPMAQACSDLSSHMQLTSRTSWFCWERLVLKAFLSLWRGPKFTTYQELPSTYIYFMVYFLWLLHGLLTFCFNIFCIQNQNAITKRVNLISRHRHKKYDTMCPRCSLFCTSHYVQGQFTNDNRQFTCWCLFEFYVSMLLRKDPCVWCHRTCAIAYRLCVYRDISFVWGIQAWGSSANVLRP